MAHICTTTTKPINLGQLGTELGVILGTGPVGLNGSGNIGSPTDTTLKTVCYSDDPAPGTLAQLNQAITAHTFNPDFGIPQVELDLRALKGSIDDLNAGRKTTFQNNTERDKIIALAAKIILNDHGY